MDAEPETFCQHVTVKAAPGKICFMSTYRIAITPNHKCDHKCGQFNAYTNQNAPLTTASRQGGSFSVHSHLFLGDLYLCMSSQQRRRR